MQLFGPLPPHRQQNDPVILFAARHSTITHSFGLAFESNDFCKGSLSFTKRPVAYLDIALCEASYIKQQRKTQTRVLLDVCTVFNRLRSTHGVRVLKSKKSRIALWLTKIRWICCRRLLSDHGTSSVKRMTRPVRCEHWEPVPID